MRNTDYVDMDQYQQWLEEQDYRKTHCGDGTTMYECMNENTLSCDSCKRGSKKISYDEAIKKYENKNN